MNEKIEVVEQLLDRGVLADGRRVSKQPGRCCATGCEVPSCRKKRNYPCPTPRNNAG